MGRDSITLLLPLSSQPVCRKEAAILARPGQRMHPGFNKHKCLKMEPKSSSLQAIPAAWPLESTKNHTLNPKKY